MNKDSLNFTFRPSGDITKEVTVARMESLRKAAARAQPPNQVIGGTIRTTANGWTLEINPRGQSASHPWKVKTNGDGTVNVAAGKILSYENQAVASAGDLPSYVHLKKFFSYDGGDITVTATGKIYASMPLTEGDPISVWDTSPGSGLEDGRSFPITPSASGSLTVAFGTSLPTDSEVFIAEIADVSLQDGVAKVDDQILTHNPTLVAWASSTPGSPA